MSDQEAWHELGNLYMAEGEFAKAAFCMEELLLHNPHSHLYHQRIAEIRYTMVCVKNLTQKKYIDRFFSQSFHQKLYGLSFRAA